jgi:hypothetical protein
MPGATEHRGEVRATPGAWLSFAVFAGGAGALDAAVERCVGPAIERSSPDFWAFVRWVDERGPHLRLALGAPRWTAQGGEQVAATLEEGLHGIEGARELCAYLPRPASQRTSNHVGVERLGDRRLDEAEEGLDQVSSEVAVEILPMMSTGRERLAYGLGLMAAISEKALERRASVAFWEETAKTWVGEGPDAEPVLQRLRDDAQQMAEPLAQETRALRDERRTGAGIGKLAAACEATLGDADAVRVRRHAHLANNRLGVTPLEGALLASIMAVGLRGREADR